jgi:hypothetical protein
MDAPDIDLDDLGEHWMTVSLGKDRPMARINLISTDEGIVVDVWSDREDATAPAASTYAFDEDLLPEEDD